MYLQSNEDNRLIKVECNHNQATSYTNN